MKDVTSTSFGLIIAFLLPGMVCLFAISFWFPSLSDIFDTFSKAESNLGLFLVVVLASIAAGLELTVVTWVLFDRLLCRKNRLQAEDFASLSVGNRLESFRACVDEHYRYHQFWGGMTVNLPVLYIGWVREMIGPASCSAKIACAVVLVLLECLTIVAARQAYVNYAKRARMIIGGT